MSLGIINAKVAWSATRTDFEAVLILHGRIACVGSTDYILQRSRSEPEPVRIIDLRHELSLFPGFVDSHLHFMDGGRSLTALSLRGCSSRGSFVSAIRRFVNDRKLAPGTWVRGGEWSEVDLGAVPDRSWIDEATTEHPVLLHRFDLHSALCGSVALALAGIDRDTENPEGGRIEKDAASGEPTGIVRETAITLVKKHWQENDTDENNMLAMQAAANYLLSHGITSCFSMTTLSFSNRGDTTFLAAAAARGLLKVRVRNALAAADIPFLRTLYEQQRCDASQPPWAFSISQRDSSDNWFLRLGAVKFFSDGSLGSRTAAMTEPYHNDKCNCGVLCVPEEQLRLGLVAAVQSGFQCVCHAIGDRALEVVLQGFEKCSEAVGPNASRQLRLRVEHCQHVHSVNQLLRMARQDVIASVQPCHLLFDGSYVSELLGPERKNMAYLFRTMLESGVKVAFGSDWMVAPADVMDNLKAAVMRVPFGEGSVVWNSDERLSPDEALRAHTIDAAAAMHEEISVGEIKEGFLGDVTVWDGDVHAYLLGNATKPKLVMTIVGGVLMYDATNPA